jgi:hypothetical protein
MSTRATFYSNGDPDIHIYVELLDDEPNLYLEYRTATVTVNFKLPDNLRAILEAGNDPMEAIKKELKP